MHNVTAVILGGGRGTRLLPLTHERSKPAVGFAGKYRLIDIPISNCINSGITKMYLLTQFMSASLHKHIMQTYQFDTFTDGFVDVLAAEQTLKSSNWFQGTADAVRATLKHTTYYDSKEHLILSGDHLYRMDYTDLIASHRASKADISICVYPVSKEEASRMGVLRVDETGEVQEFVEKPTDPSVIDRFHTPPQLFENEVNIDSDQFLASMGIYVFNPDILIESLANHEHTDFGKEIIPSMIGKYKVMAYPFVGYWKDIGTIESFFEANLSLASPAPPCQLYKPGWPIYTRSRSLPPSRIIRSEIRDSLIVEGSDINGAKINSSIVGIRSVIREGSRLDEVVMFGSDFYEGEEILSTLKDPDKQRPPLGIGRNCVIERAILDKNVRIGDDVVIRAKNNVKNFQSETYWVQDGITIIPKGTVIPPGTVI